MSHEKSEHDVEPADDRLLLVVVGSQVRAERLHRPLGYRLRESILHWLDQTAEDEDAAEALAQPLEPVVCSDLWYMNQPTARMQPSIAIGHPSENATSAFFANRVPAVFVVENTFQVLLDVELNTLWAAMWGRSASAGASAVDLFAERYLDGFLRRAHGLRV